MASSPSSPSPRYRCLGDNPVIAANRHLIVTPDEGRVHHQSLGRHGPHVADCPDLRVWRVKAPVTIHQPRMPYHTPLGCVPGGVFAFWPELSPRRFFGRSEWRGGSRSRVVGLSAMRDCGRSRNRCGRLRPLGLEVGSCALAYGRRCGQHGEPF
jgi:hypothetical protein